MFTALLLLSCVIVNAKHFPLSKVFLSPSIMKQFFPLSKSMKTQSQPFTVDQQALLDAKSPTWCEVCLHANMC